MSYIVKGYVIKYSFLFDDNLKHSSYTYQKIFRAIYGYKQLVCKANGKRYPYYRKGVLSDFPYIKSGKNSIIIPFDALHPLRLFFETGANPTHRWRDKGQWKVQYVLSEEDILVEKVAIACEDWLTRTRLFIDNGFVSIKDELLSPERLLAKNKNYFSLVMGEAKRIFNHYWFRESYLFSNTLKQIYNNYRSLVEGQRP